MAALKVESDSLQLSDPTQFRSVVHVGGTRPSPVEESAYGKLYVLTEIDSRDRVNQDIVAALQDELRNAYYRSSELELEAAFEHALQAANRKLHEYLTNGVTGWLDHFNAIVAAVKHDVVTLSVVGRMHAFLFRGNRILDITGRNGQPDEKRNPLKIFSNVLTGHLQVNDRLLLSTSSLLDFFSQEKLKRLIAEDLPSATVAKIEQALVNAPANASFGAAVFAFLPETEIATGTVGTTGLKFVPTPHRSMEDLVAKERATEQLLSPKIMPNVRAAATATFNWIQNTIRTKLFGRPPKRSLARLSPEISKLSDRPTPFSASRRSLQRILIRILIVILAIPRAVGRLFASRRRIPSGVRTLPNETANQTKRIVSWAKSLSPLQAVLITGAVVALFILSQSILSMGQDREQTLSGEAVTEAVATIEENVDRASAALTYDDRSGATRLLDESQSLLDQLPNKSKSDRDRNSLLSKKIDDVRVQSRNIVIPNVATLSEDLRISTIRPAGIARAGTNMLVVGSAEATTLVVNADGEVLPVEISAPARFAVSLNNQSVIVGTTTNTVEAVNATNQSVREYDLTFPNVDRELQAGAMYQSRLYLLDPKNDSILRAAGSGTSFGNPSQWLQETGIDLAKAVSLAVDGNIYTLDSDGTIRRFTAGRLDEETMSPADPVLASPVALWTNEGAELLYVLEPSSKRIVVFDKTTRQPKLQYVHDDLGAAIALTVDSASRTIFVLTDRRVLSFTES